MIREIATGLVMDTSMPEGCVDVSSPSTRRQRVLTAGQVTARGLIGMGTWGQLYDALAESPDGRHAVPDYLTHYSPGAVGTDDEVSELRRGLEMAERGYSRICVHPPCILTASRMNDGHSLCEHHDDLLVSVDSRATV